MSSLNSGFLSSTMDATYSLEIRCSRGNRSAQFHSSAVVGRNSVCFMVGYAIIVLLC